MSTSRDDGWVNSLTNLGHATRDKAMATRFCADQILQPGECEDLYHHDDLANRIVSAVPEEALRQGIEIQSVDDEDQDRAKEIERRLRALGAVDAVREGMLWGRCKGGAAIMLLVEGAGLPHEPLDEARVKRIQELRFIDREELTIHARYSDPLKESFGKPAQYLLQPRGGSALVVHESRLILFGGAHTSKLAREQNAGWDHSVLQRVIGALRSANTNWQSVVHMMNDFSQAVFKISGLIDAIENNKGDIISARMALMDRVRAISKALVLDAGDPENNIPAEEFQVVERGALTGVDSIIQQTWLRLATAARMPVSILMGQAPAGLNATGAIDLRWWYDTIRTSQEHEIRPRLDRIVRLVALELYSSDDPDAWVIEFPSLWQMTPAEEAELRAKIAATDGIYIDKMVALPEEIAISRWGKGRYSTEMALDMDARKAMLESDAESMASSEASSEVGQASSQASSEAPAAGIAAGTEKDPQAALTGVQITSMLEIMDRVATRRIPRESGIASMLISYPISREQAEQTMGEIGKTFFVEEPEPASPFGGPPHAPPQDGPPEAEDPKSPKKANGKPPAEGGNAGVPDDGGPSDKRPKKGV